MHNYSGNTAILFFTRQAAAEAAAKNFIYTAGKSNVQIATHLISQTLAKLRKTPFPVFTYSGNEFSVTGFGSKLTAAISDVFLKGFEEVIIIGNDCPALSPNLIVQAQVALQNNAVVLGPTKTQGVYLLGLTKASFKTLDLTQLPWQTDQVLKSLQQMAASTDFAVNLLPIQHDINSEADLKQLIRQLGHRLPSLNYLQSILASLNRPICLFINNYPYLFFQFNLPNRAPPANIICW